MSTKRKVLLSVAVLFLVLLTIGMFVMLRPNPKYANVRAELKRVPDYMYDPPSSFRGFIMGLCRQIAQVDDKEARMEFFREFQDKVFSFDIERVTPLDLGTRAQSNESHRVHGHIMAGMEECVFHLGGLLYSIGGSKLEVKEVLFRFLEKCRREELRMWGRVRERGRYTLAVREEEGRFLKDVRSGYYTPEEAAQITRRFEQVLGRPLKTTEQIEAEWHRWVEENREASRRAREASGRTKSAATPETLKQ